MSNSNPAALLGLAINPGLVDAVAPGADELRQLGASWVRFLLMRRIGGNDQIQNLDTGQNIELDKLLARYQGTNVNVLALINHETLDTSPDQLRADWNAATQRIADIAAKVARFYGNRIGALEVLNEPDNFDDGHSSRFTADNYGALLKETVRRVKAVNASLPVISAGLISPNTNYLLTLVTASGGMMDGIGWHGYLRPVKGFPSPGWGGPVYGQELEDAIHAVRSVGGKPLWITEIGASLNEIGGEAAQAEYVARAMRVMRGLGADVVARIFWFTWKFPPSLEAGKDYGLVNQAHERRPSWLAFQQQAQPPTHTIPLPPSLTAVAFTPTVLGVGSVLNVSITVRNDSDETLQAHDPPPGFEYNEGDTFATRGFREVTGALRVGVDFDGRVGIDHPYRWGLGAPLPPGQSATVTGRIRLSNARTQSYWAGMVREQVAWLVSRQGAQTVSVQSPTVGVSFADLGQQVAALQTQARQLQQEVNTAMRERDTLRAALVQIKQAITNAGL